jgi:uncharacterized protein YhaN
VNRNNGDWMKQTPTADELEQRIRELEQKFHELENTGNQYRYLVDSTSDSLYLVDEMCRYLFMNNNHLQWLYSKTFHNS